MLQFYKYLMSMQEILHRLGNKKTVKNGISTYQPQLVFSPEFWLPSTVSLSTSWNLPWTQRQVKMSGKFDRTDNFRSGGLPHENLRFSLFDGWLSLEPQITMFKVDVWWNNHVKYVKTWFIIQLKQAPRVVKYNNNLLTLDIQEPIFGPAPLKKGT